MTHRQMSWAEQHDWFRFAWRLDWLYQNWAVDVYDSSSDTVVRFTDYQALRAWAGY